MKVNFIGGKSSSTENVKSQLICNIKKGLKPFQERWLHVKHFNNTKNWVICTALQLLVQSWVHTF